VNNFLLRKTLVFYLIKFLLKNLSLSLKCWAICILCPWLLCCFLPNLSKQNWKKPQQKRLAGERTVLQARAVWIESVKVTVSWEKFWRHSCIFCGLTGVTIFSPTRLAFLLVLTATEVRITVGCPHGLWAEASGAPFQFYAAGGCQIASSKLGLRDTAEVEGTFVTTQ